MKKLLLPLILLLLPIIASAQADSIGIYIKTNGVAQKIRPIKHYKIKTNTLGAAFSYGIAGASIKTLFKGSYSENDAVIGSKFLFYFGDVSKSHPSYYMFSEVYSPRDFIVARFKTKSDRRELSVGKVNIYSGTEMGTSDSDDIEFKVKELRPGVYELSYSYIPTSGEYCFVFTEMAGSGGYLPVFDFSVN